MRKDAGSGRGTQSQGCSLAGSRDPVPRQGTELRDRRWLRPGQESAGTRLGSQMQHSWASSARCSPETRWIVGTQGPLWYTCGRFGSWATKLRKTAAHYHPGYCCFRVPLCQALRPGLPSSGLGPGSAGHFRLAFPPVDSSLVHFATYCFVGHTPTSARPLS